MSKLSLGVVCGLVFGAAAAAMMIPLDFEDETTALAAAFASRFSVGFVVERWGR